VGIPPPSLPASCGVSRSDSDSVQSEHLGLVPKELRTKRNDPAGYRVEILDLVGLEFLKELPEALYEAALLLARVVVGIAKLQENLVIWKVEGQESASGGGSWRSEVSSPFRMWQDSPGGLMAAKC
jgi:hypothetical protein